MAPNSNVVNTYIALFITYGLGTICLFLRLLVRKLQGVHYWLDDFFATAAWLFATAWLSLLMTWVSKGFGVHINDLPYPESTVLYWSNLLIFGLDLNYAFSLACSKLSILSLYWRLFSVSSIKQPIRVLAGCAVIWVIIRTFMSIFTCVPTQGIWDPNVKATCNIDKQRFFFGSTFVHLLIDVAILILPIWQISKLKLQKMQKIGLIVTFMCGGFVCVASIIVLAPAFHYTESSNDITWNNVSMFIWATVEINLAILAGSLPLLRAYASLGRYKRNESRQGYGITQQTTYAITSRHRNPGDTDFEHLVFTHVNAGSWLQEKDSSTEGVNSHAAQTNELTG